MSRKGSKSKSSKAEKREFEDVIGEMQKESIDVEKLAQSQKITFLGSAAWIAASPLYLYFSGVFETNLFTNGPIFGASFVVAGGLLYYLYSVLASQKRKKFVDQSASIAIAAGESYQIRSVLMKTILQRSTHYSLFVINVVFLAAFLFALIYILPTYQLSPPLNHVISSLIACSLTAVTVSAKML